MSIEQALAGGEQTETEQTPDLDTALNEVWEKHGGTEFDDAPVFEEAGEETGPERGPDGKFVSRSKEEGEEETEQAPDPKQEAENEEEKAAESTEEAAEGEETEETEQESEETETPSTPVPSAWQHRKELWEKMPDEAREFISQREDELHRRQSDLGRQASEYKPVREVLDQFRPLYQGQMSDEQAIGTLFNAQAGLENPQTRLQTIMQIVDNYGATDQLKQVLNGERQMPQQQQQSQQQMQRQGMTPEQVQKLLQEELANDRANREITEEIGRLKQDKPLYDEIPEQTMVNFINMAWDKLGDAASREAVFNSAYDMAVHADPDLRSKAAALEKPKAAKKKTVSTEEAKRANGVNVTSTSSGKAQQPDLDKVLDNVWEKHANGRT